MVNFISTIVLGVDCITLPLFDFVGLTVRVPCLSPLPARALRPGRLKIASDRNYPHDDTRDSSLTTRKEEQGRRRG